MKINDYWTIKYGFVLLPERRKVPTSQEADHIKVLKGEMKDVDYWKKWEGFDLKI